MVDSAPLLLGFVAITGVVVGSFLNALVWRTHERIAIGGKARSQCIHCHHELTWYDLIPIFSWLALRGKCRYCHKPISVQYPLVELANGGLWLLSVYVLAPTNLIEAIITTIWLIIISVMLAMAVYDIRWMILPDKFVTTFIVLAALVAALQLDLLAGLYHLLDPLLGVIFIAGLFYVLFQVSDGKWIGGGDVKLAVGIGLLSGLVGSMMALFIASLLGSIFGIVAIVLFKRSRQQLIAFGPFLLFATFTVFLFGDSIFNWYTSLILYS